MNQTINPTPNQMITNADKTAGRKYLKLARKLTATGGMETLTTKKGILKKGSINKILFLINPFDFTAFINFIDFYNISGRTQSLYSDIYKIISFIENYEDDDLMLENIYLNERTHLFEIKKYCLEKTLFYGVINPYIFTDLNLN
jgi:hypothetical protein